MSQAVERPEAQITGLRGFDNGRFMSHTPRQMNGRHVGAGRVTQTVAHFGKVGPGFQLVENGRVRKSCQVMALARERPFRTSQANSVLRWLVRPQAAMSSGRQPALPSASVMASRHAVGHGRWVLLHPAGLRIKPFQRSVAVAMHLPFAVRMTALLPLCLDQCRGEMVS
jgi:hypothetical protein